MTHPDIIFKAMRASHDLALRRTAPFSLEKGAFRICSISSAWHAPLMSALFPYFRRIDSSWL